MKLFFILFLLISTLSYAQPKAIVDIAKEASTTRLKESLYHLASEKMEGRLFATKSDTLASLYIADKFKEYGLKAPYDKGKSYFQAMVAKKKNIVQSELMVNGKKY